MKFLQQEQLFFASGKLLLFGEYLVLRGSKCTGVPLQFGQNLSVQQTDENKIVWQSFEFEKQWIETHLSLDLKVKKTNDEQKAIVIQGLLQLIKNEKPELFEKGWHFVFRLNFDRNFGWGTSSTLISLLSQWSNVNPYFLLENTFKGSGYDIVGATAQQPFLYSIKNKLEKEFPIPTVISKYLVFIYFGKKQSSKNEIASFSSLPVSVSQINAMDEIIKKTMLCPTLEDWEKLMWESEQLLSEILQIPTVQSQIFSDYPFAIKSLGAWGGDFIMATCRDIEVAKTYFKSKMDTPIFSFEEIVKNQIV